MHFFIIMSTSKLHVHYEMKTLLLNVKSLIKINCLPYYALFLYLSQTFEAKLLHIESRPGRKSKNSTTDLEFFMKCEVHSSDLDVFINSLKRVVDDVRSIPEEKGARYYYYCALYAFH